MSDERDYAPNMAVEPVSPDEEAVLENQSDTGRLEAFSDGVFAIAITLLVLDLKVPLPATLAQQHSSLLSALGKQWPVYLAYIISFAFILVMWINHHNLFRYIKHTDHVFLLLNGLLLLFVTVIPFPTSLLSTYLQESNRDNQRVAAVIYSATYFLLAIAFNLLWRYAAKGRRLLDTSLPQHFGEEITRRYRFGPLLYAGALVVAFFNVPAELIVSVLLAALFAWPNRPQKR